MSISAPVSRSIFVFISSIIAGIENCWVLSRIGYRAEGLEIALISKHFLMNQQALGSCSGRDNLA